MLKNILNKKYIFIIILIIIFIIIYILFTYKFKIIFPINKEMYIGIIDTNITCKIENVSYNKIHEELTQKQHGDYMIEFAQKLNHNIKIEYYDATNETGIIDTTKLLDGLNYLKEKGINSINISLSSKKYSSDIQNWINKNTDIKIYASYNNLENSYDYPAMYENVYGCGKKTKIKTKDIDSIYNSHDIILLNNGINKYKGNSYLSIYTMIKNY